MLEMVGTSASNGRQPNTEAGHGLADVDRQQKQETTAGNSYRSEDE